MDTRNEGPCLGDSTGDGTAAQPEPSTSTRPVMTLCYARGDVAPTLIERT
jgi:hypothetical protein